MKPSEKPVFDVLNKIDRIDQHGYLFELCENILNILKAESCLLFEIDEHTEELYTFCSVGKGSDELRREIKIPKGKGVAGRAAFNLKPLLIEDISSDQFYAEEEKFISANATDRQNANGQKSILAIPLVVFGEFFGVMEITSNGSRKLAMSDIEIIQPIINMITIGLRRENPYAFTQLAEVCIRFLEERDRYTHGHSLRVKEYCMIIADEMKLTELQKQDLSLAAVLHDIGKVTLKDTLLSKDTNLTKLELQSIRMHPIIGYNIIYNINKSLARVILSHHEHYDGGGYPQGLKGDEIPFLSRVICLGDTFDAMTMDRPYRQAMDVDYAIKEISLLSGKQFDPLVNEAFLSMYRKGRINILV
jgi:HD-GYP domain-containing protein (c-di-GMP phosphodiesterase class II)